MNRGPSVARQTCRDACGGSCVCVEKSEKAEQELSPVQAELFKTWT